MEEIAKEKSIEELEKELGETQKLKEEYLAGWQRARADFLNHKKEERERMQEFIKFAEEEFLMEFLPVVDNLELALRATSGQAAPEEEKQSKITQGFLQIAMQLKQFLKDHQVQEIKAEGEKFNPEFHEAVGGVEKEGTESGTVVEVLQKGYTLHGKLIRPAKVKIAK